jgi:hypothetical protein
MILRRSEISRRWRLTLRDGAYYTALGNPETLRYMIEPTLDRLFSETREMRESKVTHPVRLVDEASRCALNPMISFFLAGESALVAVVREIRPSPLLSETQLLISEGEMLERFREIGHEEVRSFCEICGIEEPAAAAHGSCAGLPAKCPYKNQPHPPRRH